VIVKTIKRQRFETASGTVKPVHESAVASKLLAKVIEMNVTAGQTVSQDQILVKLDDADLQARLKQAEAGLTNAQVLRDKASTDFARAKTLKEKNAVSAADYDAANSAMKSSEATLEQSTQAVREFQVMLDYVYSMSRENQAIITVRFFVGQDRERSLVKLFKKLDEYRDQVQPGVTGWVMKPVEIDDVPITTLTLKGADHDGHALRRIEEELVERLSEVPQVSRAEIIGGEPRTVHLKIDAERLRGYRLSVLELQRAIQGANVALPAGDLNQSDAIVRVETASAITRPEQLNELVVGVSDGRPIFLKDVVTIEDAPSTSTDLFVTTTCVNLRTLLRYESTWSAKRAAVSKATRSLCVCEIS